MTRWAISGLSGVALLPVLVIGAAAGAFSGVGVAGPSPAAVPGIPPEYLRLYMAASAAYGIPWTLLAAIGKVECDHGQDPDPSCTKEGAVNYAGAGGPMQFLASTWATYGVVAEGTGTPDRWNPADAIYGAANYLRASGAPAHIEAAIYAYNHSSAYVREVLHWMTVYEGQAGSATLVAQGGPLIAPDAAAAQAVRFALSKIGTPYVWGGESNSGFDCSGLVQAAYRTAQVVLPRVAQEQFDAGPHLVPGTALQAGDLVFFGQSASDIEHVGIVLRAGEMVDAPYPGVDVRTDSFPQVPGAAFGQERYIGATRPAAGVAR